MPKTSTAKKTTDKGYEAASKAIDALNAKQPASDAPGPTPVKESREAKLLRIADRRVTKACQYIVLIGNLAAYKPTPEDVDSMMTALGGACAHVESRLRGSSKQVISFTLREHQST